MTLQSICGHEEQLMIDGEIEIKMCSLFCDDFVTKTPGYCYLSAFEISGRLEAFLKLGKMPFASQFNLYYNTCDDSVTVHVVPPPTKAGVLHIQQDSIPSQDNTVISIGSCSNCRFKFESYSNSLKPRQKSCCPKNCSENETYRIYSLIRFTYFSNKIGSNLSVRNLILNESSATEFEFRDPTTYISESPMPICNYNVELVEDVVTISLNEHVVSYKRHDQKLKAFVHDFVSSCWKDTTDTPLSEIGIEGPVGLLTPDYIVKQTKCVLEVATCGTDHQKALDNSFRDKSVKYFGDLEQAKAKFFILVVSPQKVKTNARIDPKFVDILTQRMRMVMPLKQKLIEVLGEDVTDDEYNELERLSKLMFSSMPECPIIDDKYKYVKREIEECRTKLNESEAVSAARILLKQYEGTKEIHNASRKDLDEYLSKFTPENTRSDHKRISNVPFILPGIPTKDIDGCFEGNSSLKKAWCEALLDEKPEVKPIALDKILNNEEPPMKHQTKRQMLTKLHLATEDKAKLALSGVGGKAFKNDMEVEEHRIQSKLSFHPLVHTEDIDQFTKLELMTIEGDENPFLSDTLRDAVIETKKICCPVGDSKSLQLWENIMKTDLMKFSMLMSNVFMEMAYSYKHWTFQYEFLLKDMGHGVKALIYNPKSTMFVSFAFPRHCAKVWDEGRLGPEIYYSRTHIFTDWASFDNSQLEHFIKFGPYMGSCVTEIMNSSESDAFNFSKYTRDCINHILLLFCNNKTDAEELITSQRYLFMKLLEDVGKSPYTFVERFPKVLRSRLTAYYLKKTIGILDYYSTNSITKVPRQGEDMILYDYMNIKSLFSDTFISLNNKINEFYFGYVVSKERNTGKDKTFKVLTKLIKQEQKFRKNVTGSIFTRDENYEEFKSNMPLLKFFSSAFSDLLKQKFGDEYREKIMSDFIHSVSRTNFSDLATLKVSSRDHSKDVVVPLGSESTEETFQKLKEDFPEELLKRPFCMESMTEIIKKYEADTNKTITHISQLAPWCLRKLLDKGYFDSDQFDKSQHGGEREIHVLEFMARIVQFFVELVSRTICSYFPSETTINPDTKDTFVKDHYAKSKEMFGTSFTTISKSADATTWCQFHHSSHFAAMFQAILPDELATFTLSALSLWPRKRLSFPLKQASSLSANMKLRTSNDTYMQFKQEFEEGKGMFLKARSNTIEVISGMFQGILHTTSSLYHTMIQEVMKQVILNACKGRLGMEKVLVTICQGSDDSGCMISVPGKPTLKTMQLLKRLLLWKERVSPYLSVFCNEAKSSIGTHDLIEYNSEWHVRHMVIKPTFRWVSASQELSVTERFIDRFRIYNNMITECLTGGASTLECAVIQLFQAMMHYSLMGLQNTKSKEIREKYLELLLEHPDPTYGFFPMDEDVSCGVPGVEFQLYKLYQNSTFGSNIRVLGDSEAEMDYSPEDLPSWMKTKDMSTIRLKFSKMSVFYRVLERMNLEPLEDAVKAVERDPVILFSRANSWTDEQHNLVLKVFSKGVKESISNKSSMLRMAASSAYILTNKCFSSNHDSSHTVEEVKDKDGKTFKKMVPEKHTLLFLMDKNRREIRVKNKSEENMRSLFPFYEEYNRLSSDINNLKTNSVVLDQYIKRTSKVKLTVIPKPIGEIDVIDMCKRRWFDRGIHSLSQGQFKRKWADLVKKFPFLDDSRGLVGLKKTSENLNLNVVQTKMFLESMSSRSRSIVLYDSSSKSGNISYALSRIYWPNKKLAISTSSVEDKIGELKCKLFSIMTFWFEKRATDELCKSLIRNDLSLESSYSMIPAHGKKLKIIRDTLKGISNHDLIHKIEATKKGLLGSFVQQQSGRGSSRKGHGIWQGTICGIGVRIYMFNNTCTKIVVNGLYDTITLGWQLNQFMNESSLIMPLSKKDEHHSTNCWLMNDGRITISRDAKGVPIYQDKSMKTVGTEDTANMQWFVDINNNNVRIRARDPVTSDLITILSDTITNREWYPGVGLDVDDPVFNKWSRGESIHMPVFEKVMQTTFPKSRFEFSKQKDKFNENKMINYLNWDFKKMQKVMREVIVNRGYAPEQGKKLSEDDQKAVSHDVLSRFSNMLDSMADEFDIGLEDEVAEWAAEVEMEEDFQAQLWGIEMDAAEEEELKKNLNLFTDASTDKYYELVDRDSLTKNYNMPASSRFFSPLEHINMVVNGEPLRKSILEERKASGILGTVYTICTGKYSVGKDDDLASEVIDVEDEISSISSSVSRPGALLSLSLDEIRIHIANIQNQIEDSPKNVSKRLRRLLAMYQDREEEVISRLEPNTHDLVMLNSDIIISQLISWFEREEVLPVDIRGLDENLKKNIFTTIVRTQVSKCEKISDQEKEEVSLHLSTNSISRGSLQSISIAYDLNINLNGEHLNISNTESKTIELSLI
ncbi:P1 [Grapevine associated cogu-like virus 2]|uniref:RNA-directed RNA polymerase L n=1 Tax=Grapevine associated cogu-like virus 2 TaxID=2716184 RepID=A0A6G7M501_9VIRU|nr:P1 [Grapevine associated cogu-like virus 2]QIJ25707.1 P1 [Grapevine associated cogu-like virus 2]